MGRLATREQDMDPGLGQLAIGFQADAAGGASDECDAGYRTFWVHGCSIKRDGKTA